MQKEHLTNTNDPGFALLLKRGDKYLDRDIPKQYFKIQDWLVNQVKKQKRIITKTYRVLDIIITLQGVEYIVQAASGNNPETVNPDCMKQAMHYLDAPSLINGGATHSFPGLSKVIEKQLLELQSGKKVIEITKTIPEYKDFFKKPKS